MSVYASVTANGLGGPAVRLGECDYIDVAVGADDVRLEVMDTDEGARVYLEPAQAVELAIALLNASRCVGYVAGQVLTQVRGTNSPV